jgi:hypothetical protein
MKTLLLLFLPVLASWCSGQETPNPEKGEQLQEKEIQAPPLANKVNNDSTPFRFLSYAERKTLSPLYHYFGGMTLKRTVWPVYEYRDSALDLLVKEIQPNVLLFNSLTGDYIPSQRLEYYDQNKKLVGKVPIDRYGPYKSLENKIIDFVFPDREYYTDPEDENHDCVFSNLPKADSFLLIPVLGVFPSGYTTVAYNLAKISTQGGYMVVGWEEKVLIYNPRGEEIARLSIPHDAHSYFVSSDGKYLVYLYGGSGDNPLDYCRESLHILEINTLQIIYEQHTKRGDYFIEESGKEDFLVLFYKIDGKAARVFFDLKSRTKYSRIFSPDELEEIGKNFKSFPDLLNKYSFNAEKI